MHFHKAEMEEVARRISGPGQIDFVWIEIFQTTASGNRGVVYNKLKIWNSGHQSTRGSWAVEKTRHNF